ncbi:uncharacterized protein LOC126374342 isoform X3 [Pectinophora gossypiella]|uniref:uncharacterized protein LOC126374342 isoform X3 n=1 Tax=Pectinophora gossypiella TaxID=13191 RepID=UPI00214E5C21|nr:uncharacterized protein LOC126374342 isoform X3 [Pectinophora gossypiella]
MARKPPVSIQENIETNEEFEEYIEKHSNVLICMEVYSEFCGNCLATGQAVRKAKLEIGGDNIAMCKVQCDKIDALERFQNKSEPIFLFLQKGKLTKAMFGANGIELCRIVEEELGLMKTEQDLGIEVPKYNIGEMLPMEAEKQEEDQRRDREYSEQAHRLRVLTLAARKERVSRRLAANVKRLNFIMFWPQHHQAHYDLYEKWDIVNIQVAAKDTFQLTEDTAREALYMSDVDLNEACMHSLLSGEVLVVLFKMFDTDDRDFVKLMRYALYEEIPVPKEDVPPEKQVPPFPAYERYASISKTAREVRRERYEAKMAKLAQEKEERDRLAKETERLAREAEEERLKEEKQRADDERMARLAAGLPAEPDPSEAAAADGAEGEGGEGGEGGEKPEGEGAEGEKAETVVTDVTDATDTTMQEGELPPPEGEFAYVSTYFTLETEHLPPHVLVMFTIDKRYEAMEIANQFASEILNLGIFVGDDPFQAQHVAYTIRQYDKMIRLRKQPTSHSSVP